MATKQMIDNLQSLVKDRRLQVQLNEQAFQIFLHESLPAYWRIQFDFLVAVKYVFDRVKPKDATVIFPNRSLRFPTPETKVLLELTSIQNVYEGFQIWVEYLVQQDRVHLGGSTWKSAFKWTQHGYRICMFRTGYEIDRDAIDIPTTSQKQLSNTHKRNATEEMTRAIEKAFGDSRAAKEASSEALRDVISQTARDLLPRYMEPVPLNFAVNNYKRLMKTSYDAGRGIGMADVALQVILDTQESCKSEVDSKFKIVIVNGTILHAQSDRLLKAKTKVQEGIERYCKGGKTQHINPFSICFVSLPGTGPSDVWRKMDNRGSGTKDFCFHLELPRRISSHDTSGKFMREVLLGSVIPMFDEGRWDTNLS